MTKTLVVIAWEACFFKLRHRPHLLSNVSRFFWLPSQICKEEGDLVENKERKWIGSQEGEENKAGKEKEEEEEEYRA